MDIHIEGDMDGIATAAAIPADYYIPIIYLTAYSEEATLARARATRPYGYLIKPFSERELHATIQMTLERRSAEAALRVSQERLRLAQKMEAIGRLAGGVAHDFNNLLALVYANLDEMQEHAFDDAVLQGLIADAYDAARRGATLTQQLLTHSRQQTLHPRVVALPDLLASTAGLLRRTLGGTIQVRLSVQSNLRRTRVDPNQLENAMLNLALNARDAMPSGGTLTIEAANVRFDQNNADNNPETLAGDYISLSFSDTGSGMTQTVIERIFEPFFTTKPAGIGTGLGLSMVHDFITQSSGHIKVRSDPGRGTTVHVYLPGVDAAAEPPHPRSDPESAVRAKPNETVLIVEDNEPLRRLIGRALRVLGYGVLEAPQGAAALELLRDPARIDLMLTDIMLPDGIDGPSLVRQASAIRPDLRVIYMTGYSSEASSSGGPPVLGVPVLAKPFRRNDLARALRDALGGDDNT
jgi:signal transduction histidine kinase